MTTQPKKTTPFIKTRRSDAKGLFITIFFVLVTAILSSCDKIIYHEKIVKAEILNELQGCEEHNVNYTLYRVEDSLFKSYEGAIVFPVFNETLENDSINKIFFPAETKRRIKFTIEGYLSKNGRKESEYGCVGAWQLKIEKVLKMEDVTESFDYPIKN